MRLIDADEMLKRIESWNTSDAMDKALYNFALNRIIEQPTIDALPVDFLWKLRDRAQSDEARLMIEEIVAQWMYRDVRGERRDEDDH